MRMRNSTSNVTFLRGGPPLSPITVELCAGEELALRLVGGEVLPDTAFGLPEVFHSGAWGSFCNGDATRFIEYQDVIRRPYTQVRPSPMYTNGSLVRISTSHAAFQVERSGGTGSSNIYYLVFYSTQTIRMPKFMQFLWGSLTSQCVSHAGSKLDAFVFAAAQCPLCTCISNRGRRVYAHSVQRHQPVPNAKHRPAEPRYNTDTTRTSGDTRQSVSHTRKERSLNTSLYMLRRLITLQVALLVVVLANQHVPLQPRRRTAAI